jgi:hypothetical protein
MGVYPNFRKALAFGAFASILLSTSSAFAACYSGRAALSPQAVSDFMANPDALLQGDNARVISRVRDLVASDPSTLPAVMNLLGGANPSVQNAIGAGLGQAARICTRNDPEFARQIQQAIAASNSQAAIAAFAAASGDTATAAGGSGGGGGGVGGSIGAGAPGGGGGGGGTTGAGSPGSGTSSPTSTSSFTGAGTAGLGSNASQSASP